MFLQPLFPGENAVDQLVEIIKVLLDIISSLSLPHCVRFAYFALVIFQVLGTPTREEIRCMNPSYTDYRFPQIKAHPWHKVCNQFKLILGTLISHDLVTFELFLWEVELFLLHYVPDQVFHKRMPPEAIDLASRLLQYSPSLRCTAVSSICSGSVCLYSNATSSVDIF